MAHPTQAANLWLDAVLQAGTAGHIALCTAEPGPSDTGSTITEPAGGSYARVAYTRNATNWPAASSGQSQNGTAITFPTATAAWGTVTHWAYLTASSGGTIICAGKLIQALNVKAGKAPSIAIGTLTVYMPYQVAA